MISGINSFNSTILSSTTKKSDFNIYTNFSTQIYDKYDTELDEKSTQYQKILNNLDNADVEVQNEVTKMQIGSNALSSVNNMLSNAKLIEIKYNQSEDEAIKSELEVEFDKLKIEIVESMNNATFEGSKLFELDGNINSFDELALNGNDISVGETESFVDLDDDGVRNEGEGTGLNINTAKEMVESLKDEVDRYLDILDVQASAINTQLNTYNNLYEFSEDNTFEKALFEVSMKALTMQNSLYSFNNDDKNIISTLTNLIQY